MSGATTTSATSLMAINYSVVEARCDDGLGTRNEAACLSLLECSILELKALILPSVMTLFI